MKNLEKKFQEVFNSHPSAKELYSTEDGTVFLSKADAEAHAQDMALKKNINQPTAWKIAVVKKSEVKPESESTGSADEQDAEPVDSSEVVNDVIAEEPEEEKEDAKTIAPEVESSEAVNDVTAEEPEAEKEDAKTIAPEVGSSEAVNDVIAEEPEAEKEDAKTIAPEVGSSEAVNEVIAEEPEAEKESSQSSGNGSKKTNLKNKR